MDKDIYGRVVDSRPLSRQKCDTIPLRLERGRKWETRKTSKMGWGDLTNGDREEEGDEEEEAEEGGEGTKCSLPPVD